METHAEKKNLLKKTAVFARSFRASMLLDSEGHLAETRAVRTSVREGPSARTGLQRHHFSVTSVHSPSGSKYHILTQNLYYNYYYPKPKYLIIGYMDPKP